MARQRGVSSVRGRTTVCAVRERRPEVVAHAHGHVMVHRLLLFCACDANHELAEIVDTQRSSRSRRASTDSSFSFGDLALQGNGVEVDAEHGSSPSHCCLTRERRRRGTVRAEVISQPSMVGRRDSCHWVAESESVGLTSLESKSCACVAVMCFSPSTVYEYSLAAVVMRIVVPRM